jgi:uracil permease
VTLNNLILSPKERPRNIFRWIVLSLQHVFAMFGATVLVPLLTGLSSGVALVASGIGTLIYIICTRGKTPIYLGSSFAYIGAIILASELFGFSAVFTGLILVGLVYLLISTILRFTSTSWLINVLSPEIVGPMIMVIGLSLIPVALTQIGMLQSTTVSLSNLIVASITISVALISVIFGKGLIKVIPVILGIVSGIIASIMIGSGGVTLDFNTLFTVPEFSFIWENGLDFSAWYIFIPLSFVTIAEHIGDHTVLGEITGENYLEDPGLENTLMGDGIATMASAVIGAPANTSYGENTAVVGLTKVASTWVTGLAAIFAIIIGFFTPITTLLGTIPPVVMGGISLVLFSLIALNGVKVLIKKYRPNNILEGFIGFLTILLILFVGLGPTINSLYTIFPMTAITLGTFTMSGMALSLVVGILFNFVLKKLIKSV